MDVGAASRNVHHRQEIVIAAIDGSPLAIMRWLAAHR
jgi:hypothetical protein